MKTHSLKPLNLVLAVGLLSPVAAVADDFSLGVSAVYATSPYRGDDDKVLPFPQINYDSQHVYVKGLSAGYYLWKDPQNELSVTAVYAPWHFRPSKNDYDDMKALDRRRATVMAGLRYNHTADWGVVRAEYLGDVLDNSDGFTADLSYLYPMQLGRFSLVPGVGAMWASEDQNNYYYGVSRNESRRSGLREYHADDGWSPYVQLTVNYAITQSWHTYVLARYLRLSDEAKDSPMTDRQSIGLIGVGTTYSF